MESVQRLFYRAKNDTDHDIEAGSVKEVEKIEDIPAGYPRFSTFMSSHPSFQVYRRFSSLRTRDLLIKQDRLAVLEEKLNDLDRNEETLSFLASCRRDRNVERQKVLSAIDVALREYDATIKRNTEILKLEEARARPASALQNWIAGNPCIARSETGFLQHEDDLMTLFSSEDGTTMYLEGWVEDKLIRLFSRSYKSRCEALSRDPMVYIPRDSLVVHIARGLLGLLAIIFIIGPVIACNYLESMLSRLIVITASTTLFIGFLLIGTRAKTVEVLVAGAAYATVLTVFITQQ
ncbi:hypothetical protein BDQ94DRAFT_138675 [Aspergillus welwitschiae]|uniref:DUF6594 domain-containing protein n=1 Tax=Aspergillus welwitschiae TaxID=1341132 RepID=A0A3F3QAN9_9EURO|nr:hypothetical protein BDQ94DRAFT_138675 [Aspergillus welwitschiae]RDH36159.1 hypothetical protein BDQ94DRAFT_138675 [Aspergillus welwitschiae]